MTINLQNSLGTTHVRLNDGCPGAFHPDDLDGFFYRDDKTDPGQRGAVGRDYLCVRDAHDHHALAMPDSHGRDAFRIRNDRLCTDAGAHQKQAANIAHTAPDNRGRHK